ncbi:AAA family ATPase [Enterobacter cloacae complex sp. P21RS]|uniref:AAA family ATPase n=1 Tax=Enterobacter cloacae complex sp. P21RS TaxID=2779571 RepID=UPI001865D2F4|nr:AAA family ATPase [Enterobacter cloacae complex sp. P21RS]MBE3434775.1 AAA family ATPase [Enterobacter cloacae complex sp. P21RS]
MIRPIAIHAKNYKAYKKIDLDISKMNIFIGKNSAGKSALTRLIPMILKSLNLTNGNVLDFSPLDIDIAATYQDLVHGHKEYTKLELGATFDCEGIIINFITELRYSTELSQLVVSKFSCSYDEVCFNAEMDLEELESNNNLRYFVEDEFTLLDFDGLIPSGHNITVKHLNTFELLDKIKNYNFNLSYLGPFRSELNRTYTSKIIKNYDIGDRGQNAPYVFNDLEKKSNGLLGEKIKKWMQINFNGKYFSIKSLGQSFSVYCISEHNESNIIDEGMGFAQVFPSIVNRNVRDLKGIDGIEIIEQPELHIHPAACGIVADLYLEAKDSNIILIETHSKEFVLRVRRRIAEGINNKDVNLVYVDYDMENRTACLKPIEINKNGSVSWWPSGIFEEDFEEVIAINNAGGNDENQM